MSLSGIKWLLTAQEVAKLFSGTTNHSLDSKGRIILPTKFREELGESFYITGGFNQCVQIVSVQQFDHLREQIRQLPADKALALQYLMVSPAVEVTPNSQGRVSIPQQLREYASLGKDVVVVGMDTRVEVWDKEKFDEFINVQRQQALKEALELLKL